MKSSIATTWWCYRSAERSDTRVAALPSETRGRRPLATKRATKRKATAGPAKRTRPLRPTRPARATRSTRLSTARSKPLKKGRTQPEPPDRARSLASAIADAALEHKALHVEIIDVRGKVDYSDYVVVMSGRSDRQVNALGRHIEEDLKRLHDARCLGIEGMPNGTWLLMDYGDVIVHIFHEDTRGYYDLETLWMDAARVAVEH